MGMLLRCTYYQDDAGNITRNDGSVNVMSVAVLTHNAEYYMNMHFDPVGFLESVVVRSVIGVAAGAAVGAF